MSPARGLLGVRWLGLAFALAFLATGAMHWTIPYAKVSLPNSLVHPPLALVLVAAVIARTKGRAGFLMSTALTGVAVVAAIAARVAVDTTNDPTSHNLWPIELFLGGMLGTAVAAAGALIGGIWIKTRKG